MSADQFDPASGPSPAQPDPLDSSDHAGEREPEFIADRQRAGWGPPDAAARDRRGEDRRRMDRRDEARRADDRWAARLAGTNAEPPALRVPTPTVSGNGTDGAAAGGRLLAVILVVIMAFAGGIAVDQAAWRGTPAAAPLATQAPQATGVVRPPTSSRPSGAPGSATASGAPQPSVSVVPSPRATPGPTIGPGATVPPNAPANVGILWDALKLISEHFVRRDALNPTDLTYGAVNGLVDSLGDPGHTTFLTPDQVKSESEALSGQIIGIGIFLGVQGSAPFVQSVVSGSPAARAGVQAGDRIIAINGSDAQNLSLEEIARLVRGPEGTNVTLTVIHPHDNAPLDITVTRARITVPAVTWVMLPGTSFADIRISQFSSGTADQFVNALRGARQAGAKAIVLDLRNNPGGYVDDAVGVASQLLESGTVYIRRTADGTQIPVAVKSGGIATSQPLVVLIDYGSASSAEITAGALQDAKRGQLVGTRTYGTGTVLNTFGLPDGSAVRLGVEEWLTPAGRAIFPNGVQPDVEVDLASDSHALEPDGLRTMTSADLQASGDNQLLRAIQILTGR